LGETSVQIDRLATDSRSLVPGQGTLFIALKGDRHNGHHYIEALYRQGIRAFLVSERPHISDFPEAGFCLVENSLKGLQELATMRRGVFRAPVVAIAGSNGKTIVKEWIYQLLGGQLRMHRSPKSYNSQLGVALSLWMLEDEHELGLIEAGISMPGEMDRLETMIAPDTGIFTNLGSAHQEHFESLEQKLTEKLGLFRRVQKVIFRSQKGAKGALIRQGLEKLDIALLSWALEEEADYSYSILERRRDGARLQAQTPRGSFDFSLPFLDEASLENALHALTFVLDYGMDPLLTVEKAAALLPVSMRLEILEGGQGSMLVNDSYNADIGGLEAALDLVNRQDRSRKRILILSDLLQSGQEETSLYTEVAGLLKSKGVDHFVGVGPALLRQRKCFPEDSSFFPDTDDFLRKMDPSAYAHAVVLIKGSRNSGFERLTAELQLKNHQTFLETDLNAITSNFNYFRSLVGEGKRIMVMVKALSYGSGPLEIARVLQFQGADALAVAFVDEGIELRRAGITLPIMVLNPDPASFGAMIDFSLEPELYSTSGLKALKEMLSYRQIKNYPVHLKLDTGMHRLGFQEVELQSLLPLLEDPVLRVASAFTHLAASEDSAMDDFTLEQFSSFDRMCGILGEALREPFLRHALNSTGIVRFPEARYDMVRLGIGLHGIGSAEELIPASSFRTSVSMVKDVSEGESIGYSRMGIAGPDCRVATLPVGYADGLNRRLGNGVGKVWIGDRLYPLIGSICMDMCMVDVSGSDVKEGDPVELFGRNLPVVQVARWADTIAYEILTGVHSRVKRVYLQE